MSNKSLLKLLAIIIALFLLCIFFYLEYTFDSNCLVLSLLGGWFLGSKIGYVLGKVLRKIDEEL